jgi:hypothetical protein
VRAYLGSWRTPTGNSVDVFVRADDRQGVRVVDCEWQSGPPLPFDDEFYYLVVVRPAIIRRAQEYLESPGGALVLAL